MPKKKMTTRKTDRSKKSRASVATDEVVTLPDVIDACETTASDAHFHAVIDSLFDYVIELDAAGRVIYANRPWPGPPAGKMIGSNWMEWLDAGDHKAAGEALAHALSSGEATFVELRASRPDSEAGWFQVKLSSLPPAGSGRVGLTARDIDGSKRPKEALLHIENRYRALVEWSPDAIGVHRAGKLVYVNPAAIRMLGGGSAEEVVGKSILDFVHPDYHDLVQTREREYLRQGLRAPMIELQFQKLDGTAMDMEIQSASIDFDGEPATHTVMHDITARKQTERALLESEALHRSVLSASPDNIAITDMRGYVRMVSPAGRAMMGYEPDDDVSGMLVTDFVVEAERDRANAHLAQLIKGVPPGPGEYRGLRKDGSVFDVEANFDFIRDGNGQPSGMVFVIRDISERKTHQAKMQRVTQLYAALSECNQAIVRCTSDAELFPQICRDAVKFGGLKMAWVGLVDETSRQIKPVTAFGVGSDFLRELEITVNADEARGRGPTGTAIRENRPVWCQDFLSDPCTAPWHGRAASVGWAASAALPLHRFGVVIGALNLYAADVNAFDADVRKLLQDMALDISFALDSYARDDARQAAEQALRESEEFSLAILNSVTSEIAVLDRTGVIVSVNEPWRRFAQENAPVAGTQAPHTGVGANYFSACQPRSGDDSGEAMHARDGIQAVLDGRLDLFKLEYPCHSPTEQRWFVMNVSPLGQDRRGAVVAHSDVTERKLAELESERSNQRFRNLVDTTDGIVWEADATTFTFSFVSNNAKRLLGYSEEAWRQPGFWASRIHPEDRDQAVHYCVNCTGQLQDHEFEYRFIAADGRVVWLSDTVKVIAENGKPRWLRGLMVDITERKRTEVEMRAWTRVMEQSPASVVITDRAGAITYVNPRFEQVTGYTSAEAVGRNPRILQSGKTPQQVYEQMWEQITVGGEWRGELCNRRKNGELYWESVAISGVKGEGGDIAHFIAVKEDISDRKHAEATHAALEAQLRESQKMQAVGTLAGGIAHDFNNMLATILGNVELARKDMESNPAALESLAEIAKAGSRARDLVQQILSFSRRQPAERKTQALQPVIDESIRLLRATLPARIGIEVTFDGAAPPVKADANQIQQVLVNLINNAMQAIPDGPGRIAVRLDTVLLDESLADAHPALRALLEAHPGRTVRLSVSDDGVGMDPNMLTRIFEPFFTTRAVDEGTGLGLSVVHGILKSHEGVIVVDSKPRKGTTFTIFLPVAKVVESVAAPAKASVVAPAPAKGGQHILYVDDDESLLFLVRRLMTRRGMRISTFADQNAALDALRADPASFDLVVTDYNMPGMSGLDVARQVRAIRADLPVVVASGFIDETLQSQAKDAGVRELVMKASVIEDLCDAFVRLALAAGHK